MNMKTRIWVVFSLALAATAGIKADLLVSSAGTDQILRYDETSGVFEGIFSSGNIVRPNGLIFGLDAGLYVAGFSSNNVVRYHGGNGAFIEVFTKASGLGSVQHMAFGPDSHLYVGDV